MTIAMFDHLVFGSLVLTALVLSAIAQVDPPPSSTGFNPDYRLAFRHVPPK